VSTDVSPTAAARTVVASRLAAGSHHAGGGLVGRSVESGPQVEQASGVRSGIESAPAGSKAVRAADMSRDPEPGEGFAPVTRPGPDEWWRSP
jgi:hypothetical protein